MRSLPKIQTENQDVNRLHDILLSVLNPLLSNVLVNGALLENVPLVAASTTSVAHKLGRAYRGWIVTKNNTNSVIWQSAPTDAANFIALNASVDTTVSLWVF